MYALASLRCPSGVPWSPPLLRGRRGTMCIAKGSDVRPGVPPVSLRCPLVSASFAWQAWDNVHRQGVGCTPWRPSGVPPVSLGLRRFCVAGVGQCASARGRMYALASLRCPSGVPWSPPLLRGRRGTMCIAKGSDVRPGVPPVSLRCPLVSAAFAWQAWDNVHRQGVGCTPWRPSGVPPVSLGLRLFCVAGVGQCAADLAACSTHANVCPPASSLRSMPSSLPNGSASVEPTPHWPLFKSHLKMLFASLMMTDLSVRYVEVRTCAMEGNSRY